MGNNLLDQYSLLHFSTGVMAYFIGISSKKWFLIHLSFEILENSDIGIKFINENLTFWPGGKPKSDSLINSIGDHISALSGWYCASKLDEYGMKVKWYK